MPPRLSARVSGELDRIDVSVLDQFVLGCSEKFSERVMNDDRRHGVEERGIAHDADAPQNASDPDEIDHDAIGTALPVGDGNGFAISHLHLLEQRQRIVVVDEAHRLARMQRVERAEDRGVAEALGDCPGVERIDPVGGQMQMGVVSHRQILS